jgi:hypothetical protein
MSRRPLDYAVPAAPRVRRPYAVYDGCVAAALFTGIALVAVVAVGFVVLVLVTRPRAETPTREDALGVLADVSGGPEHVPVGCKATNTYREVSDGYTAWYRFELAPADVDRVRAAVMAARRADAGRTTWHPEVDEWQGGHLVPGGGSSPPAWFAPGQLKAPRAVRVVPVESDGHGIGGLDWIAFGDEEGVIYLLRWSP